MLTALLAGGALKAQEQEIVKEALQYFPSQTVRIEYSNPAKLRKLLNYASLRQRYLGPQLQKLEKSLSKLGIQESAVDELALGWGTGGTESDLYGLAQGHFDAQAIARDAAGAGLKPVPMGPALPNAYCLPSGSSSASDTTCVAVLGDSLGAFGSLKALSSILHARSGGGFTTSVDEHLKALAGEDKSEAPIWGVAVAPAIAAWFKTSMPGQESLELDWSQTFANVQALSYSVDAADQVHLDLRLDCTTPEAAMSLRQLLDGLRSFQQLAWPSQHPNQPNPFQAVEVDSAGQRVTLKLMTPYPAG